MVYTDDEIIMKVYRKYSSMIKEEETNEIYIDEGTYKNEMGSYKLYSNIESQIYYRIKIDDVTNFENNHIIVKRDNTNYRLTRDFVLCAVKTSNECAKQLVKR